MTPLSTAASVRMDKWLWAARVYKTRSVATEACRAGHVKVGGERVKAAREVRLGEIISAQVGQVLRTVRVVGMAEQRAGPRRVAELIDDLTPKSEYDKAREQREPRFQPGLFRPRSAGRPSKRDRRALKEFGGEV